MTSLDTKSTQTGLIKTKIKIKRFLYSCTQFNTKQYINVTTERYLLIEFNLQYLTSDTHQPFLFRTGTQTSNLYDTNMNKVMLQVQVDLCLTLLKLKVPEHSAIFLKHFKSLSRFVNRASESLYAIHQSNMTNSLYAYGLVLFAKLGHGRPTFITFTFLSFAKIRVTTILLGSNVILNINKQCSLHFSTNTTHSLISNAKCVNTEHSNDSDNLIVHC